MKPPSPWLILAAAVLLGWCFIGVHAHSVQVDRDTSCRNRQAEDAHSLKQYMALVKLNCEGK